MTIEVPEWVPGGWAVGVPRVPGVYALYAGEPPRTWVAYVGMAGNVHARLSQHFIRQDSSIVAASAVRLDLDYVRYVDWWEHTDFSDEAKRHAAELIAFDVFEPVLRSRGSPTRAAVEFYEDPAFRATRTFQKLDESRNHILGEGELLPDWAAAPTAAA